MRLNRRQIRKLIEGVVLENKNGNKPIELKDSELEKACTKVGCPKDKFDGAVGFRGNNKEGSKPADIKDAIREKLGCKPSECVIKQVGMDMKFVGWKK